ncbi:MAG: glycerol-3-phosphate acyltransferase [Clostridia bacterium]|nr:glycerol-3-phosphate acyltransferase [Clostridia bacterium]MBR2221272.1 glycerol-3-phosphate acyltransferase [Clostridia bacterium]MBR2433082.1 glycerol-3-phosphate acyltransferase [Clostridia bacterium]MBR3790545.1 glycerol-3-phosphate acyltransferase [Clostridia bacterium]
MTIFWLVLLFLGGYMIGNFSFARIISKKQNSDITKLGSGNPGTMNMLRNFGIKKGALTLVLDALKGALPSLVGFLAFGGTAGGGMAYVGLYIGGLGAILGHNFPVVYKFKGGKGVACMLGIFLVARPIETLIVVVGVFIYLCIFDYASFGSFLLITAMTMLEAFRITAMDYAFEIALVLRLILFVMFFLCFFMHRKNIFRLLMGKENKVNLKKAMAKLGKKSTKKENKQKEIG